MTTGSYPCGSSTMTEPLVFPIGASTERQQCSGCGRHLRRTMFSPLLDGICFSCRDHGRRLRGEWR